MNIGVFGSFAEFTDIRRFIGKTVRLAPDAANFIDGEVFDGYLFIVAK